MEALKRQDYLSESKPRWCAGCGDFGILHSLATAFSELKLPREKTVVISGIGCAARLPYYTKTYGFHTIHGRAPTVALGVKMANPDLSVWLITGDGDGLSIGAGHMLHALRRNVNINIILFNNEIYGLTKGQTSPTSPRGTKTKSSPLGSFDKPVNPVGFALNAGATFVARTIDRESKHMTKMFVQAHQHPGVAFVEVLQNCIVFNDGAYEKLTHKDSKEQHTLRLEKGSPMVFGKEGEFGLKLTATGYQIIETTKEQADVYDTSNDIQAHALAAMARQEMPVPLGLIHQNTEQLSYEKAWLALR